MFTTSPMPLAGDSDAAIPADLESTENQSLAQQIEKRREAKIRTNRSDLGIMIAKNREDKRSGRRESYLGFRLLRGRHGQSDPQEDVYRDAVLPIRVARKHPDLLGLLTLDYQTVYRHEKLSSRTKIVVRPGKLITLRQRTRRNRWLLIAAAGITAAVGAYALFFGS